MSYCQKLQRSESSTQLTERKVAEDLAGRLHSSLYMSIISAPVN